MSRPLEEEEEEDEKEEEKEAAAGWRDSIEFTCLLNDDTMQWQLVGGAIVSE